jgi:hypothetical protein
MVFVRKKKVKGREYYQLVESRRVDGKPRQKVLLHLGKHATVDAALKNWSKEIRNLRRRAQKDRALHERVSEEFVGDKKWVKVIAERADDADQQADALKAKLHKLRELKKDGVV